jgi:glycosyltransferase involved in cell wall biosynthesis
MIITKSLFKRLSDARAAKNFDIIFIQREAYLLGTSYFENRFKKSGAIVVFDFDDAIWLMDVSDVNKKFGWLKRPTKTAEIVSISDLVIAGNPYLADYARTYNPNVIMIPTSVDTEKFQRKEPAKIKERICIGWTGSHTTIKHFSLAIPFLRELKKKYGNRIYFKIIGDAAYSEPALGIQGLKWNKDTEIEDLSEIDIGIMPLPDDAWSRGKCGLKCLEYMALCIPPVVSPVGVNTDIVQDGINGFVADTNNEWVEKISGLIESAELRKQIGEKARQSVIEKYSVLAHRDTYVKILAEIN